VIQFEVGYGKLAKRNLGEDKDEFLQTEEQAHNEKLFEKIKCNQIFWLTWNKTTSTWAFF
jgi:hypothetical protein